MSEQPIAFEEVPGSGTSQQAIDQPQRERIAYEELQPGDVIQEGDEWKHGCGRWLPFSSLDGSCVQVHHFQSARRPYNITQLQDQRDELREALCQCRAAHRVTMASGLDACKDRDEALAEVAKLSAEVWARKPLEDRITSLVKELAQARAGGQQLLKTIGKNTDQFAEYTAALVRERDELQLQVDELRADRDRRQGLIEDLLDEPTARQVQDMLRTWATELDWAADCFCSVNRDEIDTIQRTLVAVMERIETMIHPEGSNTDGE